MISDVVLFPFNTTFSFVSVVVDYENDSKASTGGFELAYKAVPIKTSEECPPKSELITSGLSQVIMGNVTTGLIKSKPNAASLIRDIGYGMRQTLEDLLNVLQKERERTKKEIATKKHSIATIASFTTPKRNQSVETVTSNACMETQTFSKIKIMEIDSQDDMISAYQTKGKKRWKNGETNTIKYTTEYILSLLKKRKSMNDVET